MCELAQVRSLLGWGNYLSAEAYWELAWPRELADEYKKAETGSYMIDPALRGLAHGGAWPQFSSGPARAAPSGSGRGAARAGRSCGRQPRPRRLTGLATASSLRD